MHPAADIISARAAQHVGRLRQGFDGARQVLARTRCRNAGGHHVSYRRWAAAGTEMLAPLTCMRQTRRTCAGALATAITGASVGSFQSSYTMP